LASIDGKTVKALCAPHTRTARQIASALRNLPQRPAKPALNNGRVQRAARRAFYVGEIVSTADVVQIAFVRKLLLHGRRAEPHDYLLARRALELIAVRIGRAGGRGRPVQWRLR
jgi:hypothetical protein